MRAVHEVDARADAHFHAFTVHALIAATSHPGFSGPANSVRAYARGGHEAYVYNPTRQEMSPAMIAEGGAEICVLHVAPTQASTACGNADRVAQEGLVSVGSAGLTKKGATNKAATVEALLPNSAVSLTVTETSGHSYAVPVKNNIVVWTGANVATVSFTMPNGRTRTVNISEVIDHRS